jgi:hypothetical protein
VLPPIRTRRKLGEDEHEHLCIQILLTLEAVLKQDTTFSEACPLIERRGVLGPSPRHVR